MPIYEYVCSDCGHALEALQKISDAPLQACPACEKDTLEKENLGARISPEWIRLV